MMRINPASPYTAGTSEKINNKGLEAIASTGAKPYAIQLYPKKKHTKNTPAAMKYMFHQYMA